jgi:hypothetical protein
VNASVEFYVKMKGAIYKYKYINIYIHVMREEGVIKNKMRESRVTSQSHVTLTNFLGLHANFEGQNCPPILRLKWYETIRMNVHG